jgi:hypothetical protein
MMLMSLGRGQIVQDRQTGDGTHANGNPFDCCATVHILVHWHNDSWLTKLNVNWMRSLDIHCIQAGQFVYPFLLGRTRAKIWVVQVFWGGSV